MFVGTATPQKTYWLRKNLRFSFMVETEYETH